MARNNHNHVIDSIGSSGARARPRRRNAEARRPRLRRALKPEAIAPARAGHYRRRRSLAAVEINREMKLFMTKRRG